MAPITEMGEPGSPGRVLVVCWWGGRECGRNKEKQKAHGLSPWAKSPTTAKDEGMSKNKNRQEQKEAGR